MNTKNSDWLHLNIMAKETFLCVGLDSDIAKIPACLSMEQDPVLTFNKAIIDATIDSCVAYKINTAFYESRGVEGWESLKNTIDYIPSSHLIIADAKRGDIGNTSTQYAKAFFEAMHCDAITVAPYMGEDSVKPFLAYSDKWTILLGLTSNVGSKDFQMLHDGDAYLYESVIAKSKEWGSVDQLMYVIGATKSEYLKKIRKTIPDHFLLVPGVGSQGGSLEEVFKAGANSKVGLLVNASRSIIFASSGPDFALAAKKEAEKLQLKMKYLLTLSE